MPKNPCQHQGICQTKSSGYKCKCSEDWEGENCEYESDSCLSEPCKHVRKSNIYYINSTFAFCTDSVICCEDLRQITTIQITWFKNRISFL